MKCKGLIVSSEGMVYMYMSGGMSGGLYNEQHIHVCTCTYMYVHVHTCMYICVHNVNYVSVIMSVYI